MSYTLRTVTTKPANTQWWKEIYPESNERYTAWVTAFPGVISMTANAGSDDPENTWETEIICESADAMQVFGVACRSNADWIARKEYMKETGQNSVFTFMNT